MPWTCRVETVDGCNCVRDDFAVVGVPSTTTRMQHTSIHSTLELPTALEIFTFKD